MTQTKQTHLLLVDDHALFRESVSLALRADPRFRVEHCATIREALTMLEQSSFEIVLLDHDLRP
jgi:DNA-binding NarL/FixJ family response regulator